MSDVYEFSSRDQIAAEARVWLIRLDADEAPVPEEIDDLRQWLARSPAHLQELQRISEVWQSANILTELAIPLGNAPQAQPSSNAQGLHRGAPMGRPLAWAALGLLAVASIIGIWTVGGPQPAQNAAWSTVVGEQLTVNLDDGSSMQLDTDSRVEIEFSDATRRVRLLQGTAFFQVAQQPKRPFEVFAGNGLVTAVGTAFSVDLTTENIEVIVTEGRVILAALGHGPTDVLNAYPPPLVAAAENLGTLESGQIASFSNSIHEISNLSEREITRQLSWREGYLVFSGEPLHEVVAEVSRYTNMKIGIADPGLRELRVGGRFKVGDLEEIFEVLETNFGITVNRISAMQVELKSDLNS